jgi:hypothetical protein
MRYDPRVMRYDPSKTLEIATIVHQGAIQLLCARADLNVEAAVSASFEALAASIDKLIETTWEAKEETT